VSFAITNLPSGGAWLGTIQNNSRGTVQVVLTAVCITP
jgi:hypothetical protein